MEYFKGCKTQDDVKRLYREWAKKLHPDVGGNEKDMVELQRQYDKWVKPNPFAQSGQMSEEEFRENYKKGGFGDYTQYKYNTQSDAQKEYFKQRDDPRLADYERMKQQNIGLHSHLINLKIIYRELEKENETLKKKLQRLTKSLKPKEKKKKDQAIQL